MLKSQVARGFWRVIALDRSRADAAHFLGDNPSREAAISCSIFWDLNFTSTSLSGELNDLCGYFTTPQAPFAYDGVQVLVLFLISVM